MENNIEKGKLLHRFLLTINTVLVGIYAVPVGIMFLFASDSYFGFRGTADPITWFIIVVPFLLGLMGVIYLFNAKASYTYKFYIGLIVLIILLLPFLYSVWS